MSILSREEMRRARVEQFETPNGPVPVRFASPEDTLLHKLIWYQLGRQVSDPQWRDILGVLTIQGASLNAAYLDRWSQILDVRELLDRARQEVQDAPSIGLTGLKGG